MNLACTPVKYYRSDRFKNMAEREKRSRGRPKSVDRQRTIELAMDSYWREGVHALSLNELCRRSRISKPALYREFGGEDGRMEAVLMHYRALVVVPVLDALALELPFPEVMDALIVGMTAERATPAGCLFTEMRLARSRLGPVTKATLTAIEKERQHAFLAWYQQALERDLSIPLDLRPRKSTLTQAAPQLDHPLKRLRLERADLAVDQAQVPRGGLQIKGQRRAVRTQLVRLIRSQHRDWSAPAALFTLRVQRAFQGKAQLYGVMFVRRNFDATRNLQRVPLPDKKRFSSHEFNIPRPLPLASSKAKSADSEFTELKSGL